MNYNILNVLKNINLSNIISTTNRSLNIVKKSIPVYKEIRPYIKKEKSLFKIKENDDVDEIKTSKPLKVEKQTTYNNSLTFFN